jgi:Flp pilus assembly protein TadD
MLGAGAAEAQVAGYPAYREDPGTALTRHLKSLSDDPRSLHALMGAAQAALQLGDPQAAVTFFARAEEIAPRDGRIKAGIGSAFVQMEQARSALKFFADASSLGVNEGEFAGDRGLAYDLTGDNKQAQRDYRLALRHRNDPEVERRLALSLAISGDQAGALAAINDQLRRQDRAAWRTRAFVLALTGDVARATEAVQAVMPGQVAAMQPFLTRLPSLDLTGRAMAVHFGHFPGDGQPVRMAQAIPYPGPGAASQAGRPDSRQSALGTLRPQPAPEPVAAAPRRRPGAPEAAPPVETAARGGKAAERSAASDDRPSRRRSAGMPLFAPAPERRERPAETTAKKPTPAEQAIRFALAPPPRVIAAPAPVPAPIQTPTPAPAPAPIQTPAPSAVEPGPAPAQPAPGGPPSAAQAPLAGPALALSAPTIAPGASEVFGPPAPDGSPAPAAPAPVPVPAPVPAPATSGIQTVALPESTIEPPPAEAGPEAPKVEVAEAPAAAPPAAAPKPRKPLAFDEVVEAVKALPDAGPAASKPVALAAAETPKPARKAAAKAPASEPKQSAAGRHWVQIASAPDSLVASEYRRLKAKHSKLLGDKVGYRAAMGKSNRVLVGPFASAGEARDFVGQLKKNSLTAVAWSSPEGQEIEKLPAK